MLRLEQMRERRKIEGRAEFARGRQRQASREGSASPERWRRALLYDGKENVNGGGPITGSSIYSRASVCSTRAATALRTVAPELRLRTRCPSRSRLFRTEIYWRHCPDAALSRPERFRQTVRGRASRKEFPRA